jgi:predicted alpha/beta-hydrolase family hydrolase
MSFNFIHFDNCKTLNIVVHGSSKGIESSLLLKIKDKLSSEKQSFIFIEMPFIQNQTKFSDDLEEETDYVEQILNQIDITKYTNLHFIGKSIGGMILHLYCTKHTELFLKYNINFTALGYLTRWYNPGELNYSFIQIIQGENDENGKLKKIETVLSRTSKNYKIYIIQGADHSYKNHLGDYAFEDIAVDKILIK